MSDTSLLADAPIHVWRPLSEGMPFLARVEGLRGMTFEAPTALAAKAKARAFLAEEGAKARRILDVKARRRQPAEPEPEAKA